ncbi:MAG: AsmA family protein [Gammaproteobacteria bacterium]|nr:AsmA family protein [Gammaproteobacteria bacterium]
MFIIRALKWIVVVFALVVITGVLYLSFADLNWMKPRIESAVAEATGRELTMNGNFDLDILPTPSITIEDVTFSNADWGSKPVMADIGHLSTEVSLWSLLFGPVRVLNFHLRDVDVLLEVNEQEEGNWGLGGGDGTAPSSAEEYDSGSSASAGLPIIIEFAEVRNIKLMYREPEAEPLVASLESLDITTDDEKYTVIDSSGQVNDQPLTMAAKLGPEQALASGTGIQADLAPAYGKYSLKAGGTLRVGAKDYRLQEWLIHYKDTETHLNGQVGRGPDANSELSIKTAGPSLASLDPGLPAIPFEAALTAKLAREHLVLDAIETTFGKSDISGKLEAHRGDKTALSGQLQSKQLDLTPFAADKGEAAEKPAPKSDQDKQESEFVFVDEPLPFETLDRMDLDIESNIDQLIFQNLVLLDVATRFELKDGNLHFVNRYAGPQGGRSVSDITLTTSSQTAKLDMDVKMRDLRANLLSGDAAKPSQIPPVGITLDIESTGSSPRALAASATGRLLVTQGKGQVENGLMGKFSGDIGAQLFSALNPFSKEEEFTNLDCTIVGLEINKGKADITGMLLQTEKVKALGEGDIDLNTEALNIKFNTQPREGVGITADMFVTPYVKLAGTLASPSIALNKQGALLSAGAAVATGGLSVLAKGVVDRGSGEKDSCEATLAEVGGHPPLEK